MAISQTMSNPSDWIFQPYQNEFSDMNQIGTSHTNAFTAAAAAARSNNLSPEQGRVAKPIRRRSRASRRTPTTLLNTDTANFRAMVQHFTGGPAAAFAPRQQIPNYMEHVAPAGGFHVQYPNQVLQQQQQQQQQQQHVFMMDNVHGGGGAAAPGSGNRMDYDDFIML